MLLAQIADEILKLFGRCGASAMDDGGKRRRLSPFGTRKSSGDETQLIVSPAAQRASIFRRRRSRYRAATLCKPQESLKARFRA